MLQGAAVGCDPPGRVRLTAPLPAPTTSAPPPRPPPAPLRRAGHAPHRPRGVAMATCVHRPGGRGVPAAGWRLRGSAARRPRSGAGRAPPEPAGLSAGDRAWASPSGQVSAARQEAAGGHLGRDRSALRGQEFGGKAREPAPP